MKKSLVSLLNFFERHSLRGVAARELQASMLRATDRYADPKCLTRFEHQAYSQNGEDGAIREIFRRIGAQSNFFIEIGVGTGLENNSALLLADGWRGLWIEGSHKHCAHIRRQFAGPLGSSQLALINDMVTRDNINHLLQPWAGAEIDLFSLDIDMNTLHVWEAIEACLPRVCVIEYNSIFPHDMKWSVPYDSRATWQGDSYFGASLASICEVAERKGYSLVGCDLTGTNAYFVRTDLCGDHFLHPGSVHTHYEPSRTYLIGRKPGHPRRFAPNS